MTPVLVALVLVASVVQLTAALVLAFVVRDVRETARDLRCAARSSAPPTVAPRKRTQTRSERAAGKRDTDEWGVTDAPKEPTS